MSAFSESHYIFSFVSIHEGDDLRLRLPEGSDLLPRLSEGSEKFIV